MDTLNSDAAEVAEIVEHDKTYAELAKGMAQALTDITGILGLALNKAEDEDVMPGPGEGGEPPAEDPDGEEEEDPEGEPSGEEPDDGDGYYDLEKASTDAIDVTEFVMDMGRDMKQLLKAVERIPSMEADLASLRSRNEELSRANARLQVEQSKVLQALAKATLEPVDALVTIEPTEAPVRTEVHPAVASKVLPSPTHTDKRYIGGSAKAEMVALAKAQKNQVITDTTLAAFRKFRMFVADPAENSKLREAVEALA